MPAVAPTKGMATMTRIMKKLQVRNIGELVRFALAAEKRGG